MNDIDVDALVTVLAATAVAVAVLVALTGVIACVVAGVNVIDVTWGLGFVLVAWVALAVSTEHGDDTRRAVVVLLVTVWGGRLAVHLALRSRGKGEDPRYAEMMEQSEHPARRIAGVYATQAVALWIVSLPVQVAMLEESEPGALFLVGVVVWAVGFGFESIGDWQLARFRADPASHDQVMDRGLWRYTRHPNYFGDACVWWGLWLLAAEQWPGALTVVAPVLMTWTLARKTGVPTLERGMAERRPGYRDYVERTSGFVPRPPRPTRAPRS